MPAYMYVHPFFGALIAVLILGAAGIKMKWHKTGNLHYIAGVIALMSAITAVTIANWAVKRFLSEGAGFADFPLSFIPHAVLAVFGLLALFVQASMDSKMYISRGSLSAILPFHRLNAKVLIVLSAIVFLLGLITVSIMIANEYF